MLTAAEGLIFVLAASKLYKIKTDITQLTNNLFFKKVFSLLLALLFIGNQGFFVRSVAESLKISILPKSPLFFITLIYLAGVLICSHTGLKAIIRAHSFVTPFTLLLVFLLLISSLNNFEFSNVFPIAGNGSKMAPYLIILLAYFADFIILMLILPFASEKATYKKIIYPSYIISSVVLIVIMAIYTLTIPYSVSGTFFIPVYRIAQYINYRSFMARMESLFTIGWMLSYFLTSSTYLYLSSMLTGRVFNTKSYRLFMYVITVLIFIISMIPQNTNQLIQWSNFFAAPRLVAGMLIPFLILIVHRFKEGKKH